MDLGNNVHGNRINLCTSTSVVKWEKLLYTNNQVQLGIIGSQIFQVNARLVTALHYVPIIRTAVCHVT